MCIIHTYVFYIYIYIYIHRERERDRLKKVPPLKSLATARSASARCSCRCKSSMRSSRSSLRKLSPESSGAAPVGGEGTRPERRGAEGTGEDSPGGMGKKRGDGRIKMLHRA